MLPVHTTATHPPLTHAARVLTHLGHLGPKPQSLAHFPLLRPRHSKQLARLVPGLERDGVGAAACPVPSAGVDLELVASQLLSRAVFQGASHRQLGDALGLAKEAAGQLAAAFMEAFPGLEQHRQALAAQAGKEGWVGIGWGVCAWGGVGWELV